MAETYCGKTCAECAQKEILACPGCKLGPGAQLRGDCNIALCCRNKGHQECATCGYSEHCNTLRGKYNAPEYRLNAIAAEKERMDAIVKRAPTLAKWLWVLFWMIIPGSIASLLSNDTVSGSSSALLLSGQILNIICNLVYGAILFRLGAEEDRYRTAGICALICAAVSGLLIWISQILATNPNAAASALLLAIPSVVVSFVAKYNEFTAHSIVLTGLDNDLSEKWTKLWKWYLGTYCAIFLGILLLLIVPLLGLLAVLASAIGILVVSILQLVYLYKTAKAFREIAA